MAVEACVASFMRKLFGSTYPAGLTVPTVLSVLCIDPNLPILPEHTALLDIIRDNLKLLSYFDSATGKRTYKYPDLKTGTLLTNETEVGGAGSCGSIVLGSSTTPRRAYKVEIKGDSSHVSLLKALIEGFLTEVAYIMSSKAPTQCVPTFYGIYTDGALYYIVIEYIPGKLAHEYIEETGYKLRVYQKLREKLLLFHQGDIHLCHNDTHFGNTMVKYDDSKTTPLHDATYTPHVYIIDWGYSTLSWPGGVIGVRYREKSNGFDPSLALFGACLYDLDRGEKFKIEANPTLPASKRYYTIPFFAIDSFEDVRGIVGQYTVDLDPSLAPYTKFNLLLFLHTTWAWNTTRIPFNFHPWYFEGWLAQCFKSKYIWGDGRIAELFRSAIRAAPILRADKGFAYPGSDYSLRAIDTVNVLSRYCRPNNWITRTFDIVSELGRKAANAAGKLFCGPKEYTVQYITTTQPVGVSGNARRRADEIVHVIALAKEQAKNVDRLVTIPEGVDTIPDEKVSEPVIEAKEVQLVAAAAAERSRVATARASIRANIRRADPPTAKRVSVKSNGPSAAKRVSVKSKGPGAAKSVSVKSKGSSAAHKGGRRTQRRKA